MTASPVAGTDGSAVRRASLGPRRQVAICGLVGLLVGLLVVAPWVRSGYLLLLDWVSGPNQALTPGVYGLSGSALDAIPFRIATQISRALFGPAATAWLVILAFFPLAAAGIAVASGGTLWRRVPAVLLMTCNPFVYDRIRAGHVSFLLGVALLPWLMNSAVAARDRGARIAVRPAVWFALAISTNPHAAWLGGVLLVVVAIVPRPTRRDLLRTAQVVLSAAAVYTYAIVLFLTGTRTLNVTSADLSAYATRPGPGGVLATVASLHGFWRGGPQVRDQLGPLLSLGLFGVLVVAVGIGLMWLSRVDRGRGLVAVVLTLAGLLLGAGVRGPAAPLYRLAFDHLPLFEAMREQQKWLALAVIGYAIGLGGTVEGLSHRWISPRVHAGGAGRWWALPLGALPLAIAPVLFWGLGGTIDTSRYPSSWYAADDAMGDGSSPALFLPWHAYQSFSFTAGRTVATPAGAFFRRPVLVSDAVELPNLRTDSSSLRTAYLDRLVADAGADAFGRMLAPLGVAYVIVSRDAPDLVAGFDDYSWVARQPGLERVLATPDLTLYRVIPQGTGRVVAARGSDYEQAAALARRHPAQTTALLRDPAEVADPASSVSFGGLTRLSATSWQVAAGTAGWVVLPEEYAPGWQLPAGGVTARPTVAGTLALEVPEQQSVISFRPWRFLRPALLVSLGALLALGAAGIAEHRGQLDRLLAGGGRRGRPGSG